MDFRYDSPAQRAQVAILIQAGWTRSRIADLTADDLKGQAALLQPDPAIFEAWTRENLADQSPASVAPPVREPSDPTGFTAFIEAENKRIAAAKPPEGP